MRIFARSALVTPVLCALLLSAVARHVSAAVDTLYINGCFSTCPLLAAPDDAINRKSSLLAHDVTMPAFPYTDAVFSATVGCVRELLAPYDVRVVTSDPGPVARREVILSGDSTTIGLPPLVSNEAPWGFGTPIDNAIAFAFAATIGNNVDKLCWSTAQDFGTLYGLDFEYYCPDVMSTLDACGAKAFTAVDASCGTVNARTCDVTPPPAPSTQNSAAKLSIVPGMTDIVFRSFFESAPSP